MKLEINFEGNSKGYELNSNVALDITEDAEALGYVFCVVTSVHAMLDHLIKTVNPKYAERIGRGLFRALSEQKKENNPVWPFENFKLEDEK